MNHPTNNKNFLQRTLYTLFSSLLFVGVVAVTSAQSETLFGVAKGARSCDAGSAALGKLKSVENITLDITITPGGLPVFGSITSPSLGTISAGGFALSKSEKAGSFVFHADNLIDIVMTLTGKFKFDNSGNLIKVSGNFIAFDVTTACFTTGKFKAKNLSL